MGKVHENKTIYLPMDRKLRIELPCGCIDIRTDLHNAQWDDIVRIDVAANGDRYAGDPEWWPLITTDDRGVCIRVVKSTRDKLAMRAMLAASRGG